MYQLNGEDHVLAWLQEHGPENCKAMLDFLPRLAADPLAVATAFRLQPGVPACTVDVPGTDAFIDYVVIDQYRTVAILGVTDVIEEPE